MTKILTIFGTRPEAIKLFPLIQALKDDTRFVSKVCVTGQHRGMLDQVLSIAEIVPDHDLDLMQPDQTLDSLSANLLVGLGRVLDVERPDRVVVQGDTASAMIGALAAYYRQIPVIHVEAGLRSGNIYHPWPEEVNRKIVGSLATVHLAPTQTAATALRRENIDPAAIHVTGNTVIDALHWVIGKIARQPQLVSGLDALKARFAGKRIIAVTTHRRENFGAGLEAIAEAIIRLAAEPDVAIVFPAHLNPNVRRVMTKRLTGFENVAVLEPLDYPHFAHLLDLSDLLLTDSGGVQEEAPALGKPVLVMRETTERPEGVEAGTAKLVGSDAGRIFAEAKRLLTDRDAYERMAQAHNPFGDGKATQRIVEILAKLTA